MYSSGFKKLCWGMLFIIFDINLGSINVLPNFIGYLLFYSGLDTLSKRNKIFEKGKTLSLVLAFLSIKDIINFSNGAAAVQPGTGRFTLMIIGSLVTILNIFLIYIACKGVYLLYEEEDFEGLKKSVRASWNYYFIISFIYAIYVPFTLNLPQNFSSLQASIVIIYIVSSIVIAAQFGRAKSELGTTF